MLQPSGIMLLLPQIREVPESSVKKSFAPRNWWQDSSSSPFLASVLLWPANGHPGSGGPLPGSPISWLSISSLKEERVDRDSESQTC